MSTRSTWLYTVRSAERGPSIACGAWPVSAMVGDVSPSSTVMVQCSETVLHSISASDAGNVFSASDLGSIPRMPPTSLATTGTPAAIASKITIGMPSYQIDGKTRNRALARSAWTWFRSTQPCTVMSDRSAAHARTSSANGPVPANTSGISRPAQASIRTRRPFSSLMRPRKSA